MILVVFGAGASFDSAPSRPPNQYPRGTLPNRPPLANELFLPDEGVLSGSLRYFPECHPIIPYLQAASSQTIEQRLERLQSEGEDDPDIKSVPPQCLLSGVVAGCLPSGVHIEDGTDVTEVVDRLDARRRIAALDVQAETSK
jgi:hypothetical protein